MEKIVLDSHGSVASTAMHDAATGDMFLQDVQECEEVMRRCAAERAADAMRGNRKTPYMGQRCLAEIPVVLVDKLRGMGMDIMNDKEALRRFLNDPQWAAFRCSSGKV